MNEKDFNTTPEETQRRVSDKIKAKGRKIIEKKNKVLKRLVVEYVGVNDLKPNDYNPNRQSEHDFELLLKSMEEDGFTQPIVALQDGTIVDGEHRWRAARTLGYDQIPVVFTDMTPEQMRIATLRHNRARGSEDINLTADVIRDLQELGAIDWAMDSLMMSEVEMQRLLEDIAAPEDLAGDDFNDSWRPDEIAEEDLDRAKQGKTAAYEIKTHEDGTVHVSAMSKRAAQDIREREKIIQEAKTTEERNMKMRENKLFRLSLIFSGEEADLVKSVLGDEPAQRIVSLCRQQQERKAS
ncbi:ParB N-terminal domain-containing protein [bacterium]|nr:ParB N-terminal domain-containing protein [bacterium]